MATAVTDTFNVTQIKADLDDYGYVVVPELIPRDHAAHVARRLKEIIKNKIANPSDPDLLLRGLLNHIDPADDELILPLLTHPLLLDIAQRTLGDDFQMTEVGARWRKPGCKAGPLHVGVPTDWMAKQNLPLPDFCMVLTYCWVLDDLTKDNGGRLFMPFSHHSRKMTTPARQYHDLTAIEASAGSMILFNGAVWHGFNANTTKDRERVELNSGYFMKWMDPSAVGWQLLNKKVYERLPEKIQRMHRRYNESTG